MSYTWLPRAKGECTAKQIQKSNLNGYHGAYIEPSEETLPYPPSDPECRVRFPKKLYTTDGMCGLLGTVHTAHTLLEEGARKKDSTL